MKPGDLVRLKSGGPVMTVMGEGETTGLTGCEWWREAEQHYGSAFFPKDALEDSENPQESKALAIAKAEARQCSDALRMFAEILPLDDKTAAAHQFIKQILRGSS